MREVRGIPLRCISDRCRTFRGQLGELRPGEEENEGLPRRAAVWQAKTGRNNEKENSRTKVGVSFGVSWFCFSVRVHAVLSKQPILTNPYEYWLASG